MRTAVTIAATAAALALAACGGSNESVDATLAASEAGVVHVHGLAVDPGDGALLVATHRGLLRAPADETALRPVGTQTPDLMGFTVLSPNRYVASGHPGAQDDQPANLGLVESRDGGLTWRPTSLHGEADFHLLEGRGALLYGGDVRSGSFLRSTNGGRSWRPATLPAPTIDVVLDPGALDGLVASTAEGLFRSDDGARTWERLGEGSGLLAWGRAGLLVAAGDGSVHVSRDGGRTLERASRLSGPPEAVAAHGSAFFAAVHGGVVHVSEDGARTWQVRAAPRP